jgi:hypothetical protein
LVVPTSRSSRAGPRHDVRQPEGAADLDQFAARDDRFAPAASAFNASTSAPALLLTASAASAPVSRRSHRATMVVALTAAAVVEIVFQARRRAHRFGGGGDRLLRQGRAAEIGMQHRAGQVEDAALRRLDEPLQGRSRLGGDGRRRRRFVAPAPRRQHRAHRIDRRARP